MVTHCLKMEDNPADENKGQERQEEVEKSETEVKTEGESESLTENKDVQNKWQRIAQEAVEQEGGVTQATSGNNYSWKDVDPKKLTAKKSDDLFQVLLTDDDKCPNATPAACFLSRFSVSDIQDLLVSSLSHWILSFATEFKCGQGQGLPVHGIIEQLQLNWDADKLVILLPLEEHQENLIVERQQIHQIVRELVVGLYVLNQIPKIQLQTKFDLSSSCTIPTAYQDTLIGRALLDVDYAIKSLWHGAYFPIDKRELFSASWRTRLNVNAIGKSATKRDIFMDFHHEGLQETWEMEGYENAYDDLKLYPQLTDPQFQLDKEEISIEMSFLVDSISQGEAMVMSKGTWILRGVQKSLENSACEDTREHLRKMCNIIREKLQNNEDVMLAVEQLKIVASIMPVLIALKKKQKIPNLAYLDKPIPRKLHETVRELPPLIVGPDFKMVDFYIDPKEEAVNPVYFSLHGGIQFDIETSAPVQLSNLIIKEVKWKLTEDKKDEDATELPVVHLGKAKFSVLELQLEPFIWKGCQKPVWANQIYTELSWLKFKCLPLTCTQLQDQFQKLFGANADDPTEEDNIERCLQRAAEFGLTAAIQALLRDFPTIKLEIQSEDGWSLMHLAAKGNQAAILGQIIQLGLNTNTRKFMYKFKEDSQEMIQVENCTGATPLHLACQIGAIEAVSCLLSCHADPSARDNKGWAPVHHAAHFDQMPVLRLLLLKTDHMETPTDNRQCQTPLLLCAASGGLQSLRWLLEHGADGQVSDSSGRNVVHLATLNTRIHILRYLIDSSSIQVWSILAGMLLSVHVEWQESAIKCIRVLSDTVSYQEPIVEADLHVILVNLLVEGDSSTQNTGIRTWQSVIVATLCNVCIHSKVHPVLSDTKPLQILVKILNNADDLITASQAASILGDVAADKNTQTLVGNEGGIAALSKLLKFANVQLILNTLKAISVVCCDNKDNQNKADAENLMPQLVKLFETKNEEVWIKVCQTFVIVAQGHQLNQSLIISAGALPFLNRLLSQKNVQLQSRAAAVVEILAKDNPKNQICMLEMDVLQPTIMLLKGMDLDLKKVAAKAIWAMAGKGIAQRRLVAKNIGTNLLINMLMTKSEVLVCTCCPLVSAVVYEDIEEQIRFLTEGGVQPLLRLLDPSSSTLVLTATLRTLSTFCVGVSYMGNRTVQNELAKQGIFDLSTMLLDETQQNCIRVEALHLLICVALNHKGNLKDLNSSLDLVSIFKTMLHDPVDEIRLLAGMALALYAYNKTTQWNKLKQGGITLTLASFDQFLKSDDESQQCLAAFHTAILGQLVVGEDSASCTATGVELLVEKLTSEREDVFVLAGSLVSSLAYGRPGVSDALVLLGVVEMMLDKLASPNQCIRSKSASTLACLSHHRTAKRKMMSACRRKPELFERFMENLPKKSMVSQDFVEEFQMARENGLPSEWYA